MIDGEINLSDGRTVAYTDFGPADGTPVLWCHGGPGSRREPEYLSPVAAAAGLRIIALDRPGYGGSTPNPGRRIGGWVPEAMAVLDALGVDRCITVGVSTGGGYALAVAALEPDRVIGAVACRAMSDMRWAEGKAMVTLPAIRDVWEAPDRDAAMAAARSAFLENPDNGKQYVDSLSDSDRQRLADPAHVEATAATSASSFAQGFNGYVDDRIADGIGWGSFDAASITCPTVVVHGAEDNLAPVPFAHYTASLVPGARLEIVDGLGHQTVIDRVVDVCTALLATDQPSEVSAP